MSSAGATVALRLGAARFFAFFVRFAFLAGALFAAAALRFGFVLRGFAFFVDFFFAFLRAIQRLLQSATRRKFRAWRQRSINTYVPISRALKQCCTIFDGKKVQRCDQRHSREEKNRTESQGTVNVVVAHEMRRRE